MMWRVIVILFLLPGMLFAVEEGVSPDAAVVIDGETLVPSSVETSTTAAGSFSGDLRVRLRDTSPRSSTFNNAPDVLRHRPYFYQRSRIRWNDAVSAGWVAVRPVPGPSMTADGVRRMGTVKGYVELPGRAVLGDYSLAFGQGLLFYDQLGEFVRPDWVQGKGARPDLGTMMDAQLRGAVVRVGGVTTFVSRRALDAALNDDGTSADTPWALRQGVMLADEGDIAQRNTLEEKTAGVRGEYSTGAFRAAATAVVVRYAPGISPDPENFSDAGVFRGKKMSLAGVDGSWVSGGWRAAVDAAFSEDERRRGGAVAVTLVRVERGARWWASVFDYDRDYAAPQGKGPSFEVVDFPGALPANQRGLSTGIRRSEVWGDWELESAWARFPSASGNGRNQDPVFPAQARRWRMEATMSLTPSWDVSAMLHERVRDRYAQSPGTTARSPGEDLTRKARLESAWTASPRVRLKIRGDARWERSSFAHRAEGTLVMTELRWSDLRAWTVTGRWYAFHSPEAYLTTGVEEIWDGVVAPRLPGGMGTLRGSSGERIAVIVRRRWGRKVSLWAKYDAVRLWRGALSDGGRHGWHGQMDYAW